MLQNGKIEMARIVNKSEPSKKDPEEKLYLLCIAGKNNTEDTWYLIVGRTEVYETIKNEIENIDLENSFILVESAKLENRKSIYAFMKYVESFYEDSFDIEDYIKGDWSEDEFDNNYIMNDINTSLNIDNNDRLDMASFINGEINSSSLN